MSSRGRELIACVVVLRLWSPWCSAATLSTQPLALMPGETDTVVVSGAAANEATFGVTILVEIVPRPGNRGTVTFTAAPPADIALAGHPWLGVGAFTPFDTDLTESVMLNGSVHDNGSFIPAPVTYDGLLAGFPVVVSPDAFGTWDVLLWTSLGPSTWEGLATTVTNATITVPGPAGVPTVSGWGVLVFAQLIAAAGTVAVERARSSLG